MDFPIDAFLCMSNIAVFGFAVVHGVHSWKNFRRNGSRPETGFLFRHALAVMLTLPVFGGGSVMTSAIGWCVGASVSLASMMV